MLKLIRLKLLALINLELLVIKRDYINSNFLDGEIIPDCDGDWTPYFDIDNPNMEGDFEKLDSLKEAYPGLICPWPLAIDAKAVGTISHHPIAGQIATLSTMEGFSCRNSRQNFGTCLDYEVRFCCPIPDGNKFVCT